MHPADFLARHLRSFPGLAYERTPGGIRIAPAEPDGFAIELMREPRGDWLVAFGAGLIARRFVDSVEALEFVAFGLSHYARLTQRWRGARLQKAVLERLEGGKWVRIERVRRWPYAFWRRERIEILQNGVELANLPE